MTLSISLSCGGRASGFQHRVADPQAEAGPIRGRPPGRLVHVDINKQCCIPDGGGWRAHCHVSEQHRRAGAARSRAGFTNSAGVGYELLQGLRRRKPTVQVQDGDSDLQSPLRRHPGRLEAFPSSAGELDLGKRRRCCGCTHGWFPLSLQQSGESARSDGLSNTGWAQTLIYRRCPRPLNLNRIR